MASVLFKLIDSAKPQTDDQAEGQKVGLNQISRYDSSEVLHLVKVFLSFSDISRQ